MEAAANKSALDLAPVACLVAAGGGSWSKPSIRGRGGGDAGLDATSVLGLRRRSDVYSGIVVELWSFPRSKMEEGSGPGGIRWCEGEGSSFLDPEQDELGGFRRPICLHRLDPTRWSWWILRLINAFGKEILLFQFLGLRKMLFFLVLVFFKFLLLYPICICNV